MAHGVRDDHAAKRHDRLAMDSVHRIQNAQRCQRQQRDDVG